MTNLTENQTKKLIHAVTKESPDLKGVAKEIENLSQDTLTQMLQHAKAELDKRLELQKFEAMSEIATIVKQLQIPFDSLTTYLESQNAIFAQNGDNLKARKMYRDQNGNFWNGLGRKPKWLMEHLENGVDINTLKIDVNDEVTTSMYYYNPNKPKQRWNGHGRNPDWFIEMKEQGINVNDYVIQL